MRIRLLAVVAIAIAPCIQTEAARMPSDLSDGLYWAPMLKRPRRSLKPAYGSLVPVKCHRARNESEEYMKKMHPKTNLVPKALVARGDDTLSIDQHTCHDANLKFHQKLNSIYSAMVLQCKCQEGATCSPQFGEIPGIMFGIYQGQAAHVCCFEGRKGCNPNEISLAYDYVERKCGRYQGGAVLSEGIKKLYGFRPYPTGLEEDVAKLCDMETFIKEDDPIKLVWGPNLSTNPLGVLGGLFDIPSALTGTIPHNSLPYGIPSP